MITSQQPALGCDKRCCEFFGLVFLHKLHDSDGVKCHNSSAVAMLPVFSL